MANIPISQLPELFSAQGTTLIPVVYGGITYQIERDNLISRSFAQYINTIDQLLPSGSATTVNLNTILVEYGMSLSANEITFISGGTFLISASYQFSQGAGSADVAFWFTKNNNSISNSATHQSMQNNSKNTSMVTFIESFNAGDKLILSIESTSSNTTIDNIVASGSIPDAPGVILSINEIY